MKFMPGGKDASEDRLVRKTMMSGARRRSVLEMLFCVLLVAALAGQPAWGDADNSKSAPVSKSADKPRPAGGEKTSDPTPAPADEPRPVDVPSASAQQEEGAGKPARPTMPGRVPQTAAPAQATPEVTGRPSKKDGSSTGEAISSAVQAQKEMPEASSTVTPTKVTPLTPAVGLPPPTGTDPGSVSGSGEQPPASDGLADPPTGADLTDTPDTTADPPLTVPNSTLFGPPPTGNPVEDGPVLQVPAREITQLAGGTRTSRPQNSATPGVETLREPSAINLNPVAGLLKDIPAWIKFTLAGLAALVLLLGAYTVLAAMRTRRLERQRSKLMEDIGLLQAALLPAVPGRLGALLTTVAYRPADGPAAGGDFYDAFALSDGRVGLLLGDISGHGRQALAKTALVRFTVRAHLEAGLSPREALSISGRSLDGRLSDDFSTVIAAIHDPIKGTLTYASAGHPAPLVIGPQAHKPVTASSAPPIGAGFPTGQRQTVLPMPDGSTVAVYSDGLIEARIDGEGLGRERLSEWLAELGPEATAKALIGLVVQRADRVPDDLAAVVLHAAPGATAPAARVEQLKLDVLDVEGPELDGFLRACGVSRADRAIAARRVAEQLAVSGGVVVEVRIGEHPMVSVAAIGDQTAGGTRFPTRSR